MKITIYELLGMIKDGKLMPERIKFENYIYIWRNTQKDYFCEQINYSLESIIGEYLFSNLNLEVEILEEEKKFTKEDFIKERMELDGITRERFDEKYEVKECNCGMPYCKGFIAKEKKENKIPEKLEDINEIKCVGCKVEINIAGNKTLFDTDTPIVTEHCIYKINQLIKNQKKIIDFLKNKVDE